MVRNKRRRGPVMDKGDDEIGDADLSRFLAGANAFSGPERLGDDRPSRLVLRREAGGLRHYLAGEPVHAGDIIEALTDDGAWVAVRYEWTYREADEPVLVLDDDRALARRPNAGYRWPGGR